MRYHVPSLLALAALAAALETPLTISSTNNRVVVIDPALGSITSYEVTQSSSNRVGLGKANGNFVADAEMLLKYCQDERDGVPFQALRSGSRNNKPGYGDILAPKSPLLADKPTKKELAAGKPALTVRALHAEDGLLEPARPMTGWCGPPSAANTSPSPCRRCTRCWFISSTAMWRP